MNYVSYNIALNGRHFFATHERLDLDEPADFAAVLCAKFPASEGYSISRRTRPNAIYSTALEN